jgi:hypothetical protein
MHRHSWVYIDELINGGRKYWNNCTGNARVSFSEKYWND